MGTVRAVCVSERKGTPKRPQQQVQLAANYGVEGDAHAGTGHRQVSLLAAEQIDAFRKRGAQIEYGAFGENVVVEGLDLGALRPGTRLRCGNARLEVTQIGKECHTACAIREAVGDCIMPREGVFARVLQGGMVRPGDAMTVEGSEGFRPYTAAVVTLSDRAAAGEREDTSGPLIAQRLRDAGCFNVREQILLLDEEGELFRCLCELADEKNTELVLTTGSTGFAPRDIAPEATARAGERSVPGISEAIRAYSMKITPRAMFSRGVSVIRGRTLIINLPGSTRACQESLDCILEYLPHGLDALRGDVCDCARP